MRQFVASTRIINFVRLGATFVGVHSTRVSILPLYNAGIATARISFEANMIQPRTLIKLPDSSLEEFKTDESRAYYLAGKAASIHLGNKRQQLPAVYFEINPARQIRDFHPAGNRHASIEYLPAHLEGGRLIHNLSVPFAEFTRGFDEGQMHQFRTAFEADVVNLITGAVAEAKYRFQHFGETMGMEYPSLRTLYVYADNDDLDQIGDYLDCLAPSKDEHERMLTELFAKACEFVNIESNWTAITTLANYIHHEAVEEITCEQLIALLEANG